MLKRRLRIPRRVGIVNDSVMAFEVLRRVVLSVPGQEVAWIARDGEQAMAMTRADGPDLLIVVQRRKLSWPYNRAWNVVVSSQVTGGSGVGYVPGI